MSVGMVIMRPTSIVVAGAGSSASVRAAGGVEFATATSLSLNGVFTADYDDYMIVVRHISSLNDRGVSIRWRISGVDDTSSNYARQRINALSTTVSASRTTGTTSADFIYTDDSQRSGTTSYVYGPFLSQPTAHRSCNVVGLDDASLMDVAATHSLSSSYDGFTLFPSTGTTTGQLTVFGLAQ
jgi:hypothetical protein